MNQKEKIPYAQGPVSIELKALLKGRIKTAKTDEEINNLLNEIHDMTLTCRNDPDGLKAAVRFLKGEQVNWK